MRQLDVVTMPSKKGQQRESEKCSVKSNQWLIAQHKQCDLTEYLNTGGRSSNIRD